MGIGDFLKKMFSSDPVPVDYSGKTDSQLRDLAEERDSLTAAAQEALARELESRGLELDEEEETHFVVDGDGPPIEEPYDFDDAVLFAQQNCGVFVETSEGKYLLVCLPLRNQGGELYEPAEPSPPEGTEVTGLVVLNERDTGWLPARDHLEHLGLTEEDVHVLADAPAHRTPTGSATLGTQLPSDDWMVAEGVGIRRVAENVIHASWPQLGIDALVGAPVPLDTLLATPATALVVGGIRPPASKNEWDELPTMLERGLPSLRHVVLLLDFEGATVSPWVRLLPQIGVNAQVEGPEALVAARAQPALDAAYTTDDDAIEDALSGLDATYVSQLVWLLVAQEDIAAARFVVDAAQSVVESCGALSLARGIVEAVEGDLDAARVSFEEAARDSRPEPRADAWIATICIWRGDFDAARERLAAWQTEDQEVAAQNLVLDVEPDGDAAASDLSGRIVEDPVPLLTERGIDMLEDDDELAARIADERPLPLLAEFVASHAASHNAAGRPDAARTLAGWALRLNPFNATAMVADASATAELEGLDAALGRVDEQLARWPNNRLLRLTRAELHAAAERDEEANTIYEELVDEHSRWAPPRIRLVQVYAHDDRVHEAEALLEELADLGVDDQVMFSLEVLVDDARLRRGMPRGDRE